MPNTNVKPLCIGLLLTAACALVGCIPGPEDHAAQFSADRPAPAASIPAEKGPPPATKDKTHQGQDNKAGGNKAGGNKAGGNKAGGNKAGGGKSDSAKPAGAERIKATNLLQLKARIGKTITAYGRVDRISSSGSGHKFVNFSGGQLSAICRKENVAAFKGSQSLDRFRGKDIELQGELKEYKGKLQIELSRPSQIRLAAAVEQVPRAELKKIGKNSWISPRGLRYQGLDPQGKTRVEHIMRHAKDDPGRSGPHGVFDPGDQDIVFGLIDEAWRIAESKKLRANREGARSTYTILFPKKIGYLGGQSGRRQGKPPLKRVFIVFESGTKNIITAFPK